MKLKSFFKSGKEKSLSKWFLFLFSFILILSSISAVTINNCNLPGSNCQDVVASTTTIINGTQGIQGIAGANGASSLIVFNTTQFSNSTGTFNIIESWLRGIITGYNYLTGMNYNNVAMINQSNAFENFNQSFNGSVIIKGSITANVYHSNIDWINVPISVTLTGTTACSNLNNLVTGYIYTCQTCTDSLLGGTIACSTVSSVIENCACKVT